MKKEKSDLRVCSRLRAVRKAAGFRTSYDFSKKYNIPKSTYSQHESGSRIPRDAAIEEYASYLGINYNWLRYGEGLPFGTNDIQDERNKKLAQEIKSKESELKDHLCAPLDENLLTSIFMQLIIFTEEKGQSINARKLSKAAVGLYSSLSKSSSVVTPISDEIVKIAIETYFHFAEKP